MGKAKDQVSHQLPRAEELFRQLTELLFSCSQELARSGGTNWERAEALFKLAKSADQLRSCVVGVLSSEKVQEGPDRNHTTIQTSPGKKGRAAASKSARTKRQDYPRYRVRGNLLFKTGLRRDAQKEYEHILPKQDFDAIVAQLSQFSASRKDFGVEEIQQQLRCPAYQIYTVLSLLKARDILLVPKRGLYSFRTPGAFSAEASNLWEELRTNEI